MNARPKQGMNCYLLEFALIYSLFIVAHSWGTFHMFSVVLMRKYCIHRKERFIFILYFYFIFLFSVIISQKIGDIRW